MIDDAIDAVQFLGESCVGDFKTQLAAGLFFQMMGFVDDETLVILQNGSADGQVGQEQGVIDDQDVGRLGSLAGLAQEAGRPVAEGRAALQGVGADARPGGPVIEVEVEPGTVAVVGIVQPDGGFADDPGLVLVEVVGAAQVVPAMQADVVGTALELRRPDHARLQDAGLFQDVDDGGDVLVHQLFLQVDGVGRDDDALAVGGGVKHGRQQVGDAFADAGAALHNQLAALVDGAGDGLEHFGLLRSVFKAGKGLGKDAVGGQQFLNLLLGELTTDGVGGRGVAGNGRGRFGNTLGQLGQVKAADCRCAGGVGQGGVGAHGVGDDALQQVGDGGVGGPGGAGDEGNLGGGVSGGDFQQAVKHQGGSFGVAQSAVLFVADVQVFRQGGQVVFGQGGQEYRRQIIGIVVAVGQRQVVGAQKTQVKGDVVADDRQVADEVGEPAGHLVKDRSTLNLSGGD